MQSRQALEEAGQALSVFRLTMKERSLQFEDVGTVYRAHWELSLLIMSG